MKKTFKQFLIEMEENKNKEKKKVFKETDGVSPFPENTIRAIKKQITTFANDLDQEWESAAQLVNKAFEELDVPLPMAWQKERWQQYAELLEEALKKLYNARGVTIFSTKERLF